MPRVPTVPSTTFVPWANEYWTRLLSPVGGGFEVARWRGRVCGADCVIVAYRVKGGKSLRLAVQGTARARVASLTEAVYQTYQMENGARGVQRPRPGKPGREWGA